MIAMNKFAGRTQDSIIDEFEPPRDGCKTGSIDRTGVDILLAFYDDVYGYSWEAFVLFRRGDELYSVEGSHCSCYGLEGQWTPVRTTVDVLRGRIRKNSLGKNWFDAELSDLLDRLIQFAEYHRELQS